MCCSGSQEAAQFLEQLKTAKTGPRGNPKDTRCKDSPICCWLSPLPTVAMLSDFSVFFEEGALPPRPTQGPWRVLKPFGAPVFSSSKKLGLNPMISGPFCSKLFWFLKENILIETRHTFLPPPSPPHQTSERALHSGNCGPLTFYHATPYRGVTLQGGRRA